MTDKRAFPPYGPTVSVEELVVDALPPQDKRLLQAGAVLRYITRDLASLVVGSAEAAEELLEHPLLQPSGAGEGQVWTMPEPIRRVLVTGWAGASAAWMRISQSGDELEAIYASLAVDETRAQGLRRLQAEFDRALEADALQVAYAHDLLRILDEWPVNELPEARALRDRLTPRLRRHSRSLRDREASEGYFERDFEREVMNLLMRDGQRWLLHLHGLGGRGKSMFLKNLLGRYCPQNDIPVAWIDFDHIDQLAINTTQPWRLLLTMARQLDSQLEHSPFQPMLESYGHLRAMMHAEALPQMANSMTPADESLLYDDLAAFAEMDVPRKFRTELASAVQGGPVVLAVDTVENLQHADGADFERVLAALAGIRHGDGASSWDEGVPGLRVIVSGRFDLGSNAETPDGPGPARSKAFQEALMGSSTECKQLKRTQAVLGHEAISVEIPPFSHDEAHRYVAERLRVQRDVAEAIVRRSKGNPLKLALFIESVEQDPDVTAEEIEGWKSAELAYLVTRVVDRINDGLVQWILRWGALLKILTKEGVDQIIWPALHELVLRGADYDEASSEDAPQPAKGVMRWHLPDEPTVSQPGAASAAWAKLLRYAATSSWVSPLPDLPHAVVFHPEVRDPLRALLRAEGNPVHDDIHRRAFDYWQGQVAVATGRTKAEALRGMVFHAYEQSGDPGFGDSVWSSLIGDPAMSREDRSELADEVLVVSQRFAEAGRAGPSAGVVGKAHLERGEGIVHDAISNGRPINERALSTHRHNISPSVRDADPGRVAFLDAAIKRAIGENEEAWKDLGASIRMLPSADAPSGRATLELISDWARELTPPPHAILTARLLADVTSGTNLFATAALPLARGLEATEQWSRALEVATATGDRELIGRALLGLGRTASVLSADSMLPEHRAEAALLELDTDRALSVLASSGSSWPAHSPSSPAVMLLAGQAYALARQNDPARAALSEAASSHDTSVAFEARLALARLMAASGDIELAVSNLDRDIQGPDPVARIRSQALIAVVSRNGVASISEHLVEWAHDEMFRLPWVQPSVRIEVECARLSVLGPDRHRLEDLRSALNGIDGPHARLRALRWLTDVPATSPGLNALAPALAEDLRSLTEVALEAGRTPAWLMLTRADLERVLGAPDRASLVLDELEALLAQHRRATDHLTDMGILLPQASSKSMPALRYSINDARYRLSDGSTGWQSFNLHHDQEALATDPRDEAVVRISSEDHGAVLAIDRRLGEALRTHATLAEGLLEEGPYALAADPVRLLHLLDEGLGGDDLFDELRRMGQEVLVLDLRDELAARWPWELARRHSPLTGDGREATVIRSGRRAASRPPTIAIGSPEIYVAVLDDRRDSGQLSRRLLKAYEGAAWVDDGRTFESKLREPLTNPKRRIVHLLADPVERRRPALRLASGDHLTPERLASTLDPLEPALLILDLNLAPSDSAAAEQLMLGNAFCWHIVHNANDLSVICGAFSASEERSGALRVLVDELRYGTPLAHILDLLRRQQNEIESVIQSCVSLTTDQPDRVFSPLGGWT